MAWFGDGNNVACSWVEAAALFGFELRLAGPATYRPPGALLAWAREQGASIILTEDAHEAADKASVLVTDVWQSMGDEAGTREADLMPYQVNDEILKRAEPDAIFLHCLPAIRGQEVSADIIDGAQSAVLWHNIVCKRGYYDD